jgi:hypothetical protein
MHCGRGRSLTESTGKTEKTDRKNATEHTLRKKENLSLSLSLSENKCQRNQKSLYIKQRKSLLTETQQKECESERGRERERKRRVLQNTHSLSPFHLYALCTSLGVHITPPLSPPSPRPSTTQQHKEKGDQGADCHDVDDGHWINGNPTPIAHPMSGYPLYAARRKSWGINGESSPFC